MVVNSLGNQLTWPVVIMELLEKETAITFRNGYTKMMDARMKKMIRITSTAKLPTWILFLFLAPLKRRRWVVLVMVLPPYHRLFSGFILRTIMFVPHTRAKQMTEENRLTAVE